MVLSKFDLNMRVGLRGKKSSFFFKNSSDHFGKL